jgi:GT2 family glycosyltransferase
MVKTKIFYCSPHSGVLPPQILNGFEVHQGFYADLKADIKKHIEIKGAPFLLLSDFTSFTPKGFEKMAENTLKTDAFFSCNAGASIDREMCGSIFFVDPSVKTIKLSPEKGVNENIAFPISDSVLIIPEKCASGWDEQYKSLPIALQDFCFKNIKVGKHGITDNVCRFLQDHSKQRGADNENDISLFKERHDPSEYIPFFPDLHVFGKKILKRQPVSIIIPSKNNFEVLEKCIDSILRFRSNEKDEIIVADTGSEHGLKEEFKNKPFFDKINFLEFDYYHFGKINNEAVNHASNPLILFCNDDVEFLNDAVSIMANKASEKGVGTVGCRLHYPNHKLQHCGIMIQPSKIGFWPIHIGMKTYYKYPLKTTEVLGCTGAALMIKKSLFKKIGGFIRHNEDCFEDVILNVDALAQGMTNYVCPHAVGFHHESMTRKKDPHIAKKLERDYLNILSPYLNKKYVFFKKYITGQSTASNRP